MTLLAATDLAFGYPGRVIGRGIDLAVAPGEVLALLGPNGGGKTTLLKTLLGLLPPRAGSVTVLGRPLAALPARERARALAYVPQSAGSAFAFTARAVVLMGRSAHAGLFSAPSRADRASAEAALARMGVLHLADRAVTRISGGERQLVLIARALAQEPRLVILDEPTASLDFGNQGKVMREITRLRDDGLGVIFTTHDPNQAARYADRALLLRAGGRLAEGPVAEVLAAERLEGLYGAPVEEVRDAGTGARAFLPG
ncbi:ABC transporter ATP-binding protein [Methylobacterium isbiliense]|jgi:iron complex transport system ATP-binding protein|uniref:ABC transporter ATP-binding protein n=1 Tax=Methylobacterium isbiliense TaxID=315478 RepID=A0ABQ4SKH5_9HYPH|nr:ABC transporter ATP-binding protein [Methylobacterium isbiliense]MDN3627572.1 ABC transporter ATP-binding protein [Methylobacterium isbiliense]GJE03716.1 putative ABC transporter ATP-binding protein [Methylobacterium isbiliense]